jgi:MscS family membrane protein
VRTIGLTSHMPKMFNVYASIHRLWLPILFGVLLVPGAVAADARYPLESADTSSPRATFTSFLAGMQEIYLVVEKEGRLSSSPEHQAIRNRVLRCLDLSELSPAVRMSLAKEAAVCLKEVLDRIELPPESAWPESDEIAEQDLTKWTIPHTEISIIKIKDGPDEGEFLFSAATVERANDFYEIVKGLDYIERETTTPGYYERFVSEPGWMIPHAWLPSWIRTRWYGQAIWQWVGLVLSLLLASVLMISIYLIGRWRATTVRSNVGRYWVTLVFPIAAMLVPLATRYFVVEQLQIYGYLVVTVSFTLHVIFLIALMVLVVSVGSRLAELIIATPWVQPVGLDAQLVRLTCRVLSIIGAMIVLLEGGQQLGVSLTTLLTGAGVGGLALALAAQDSLKNILGSMMIMLDKPFKVGERIIAKGYEGIVEDIGLRSTKLRSLTGHQVSIPNEEMARADIENVGRRPYIRRSATIELPSDTRSATIRRALEILREILKNHEGMNEDLPPRVFLRDVNESSIGIFMTYWYHPPEYWEFLAFSEHVTLQMTEQFETEGIPFASPALNVRLQSAEKTAP